MIPEASIWRKLDSKRWIWPLLFEARFAKGVARKRKLARKKLCVYKKSKSGRVSGGPDLKATAASSSSGNRDSEAVPHLRRMSQLVPGSRLFGLQ